MRDIDIINSTYGLEEFERLPLWENVNKIMDEVDKICKKLIDKEIIIDFSFNMSDNILKLHINPANLMINCNRLEELIAGEEDKESTTKDDIEKKKYKSKEEMNKLQDSGIFKNWTRLSNINNQYIFIYKQSKPLQERKQKHLLFELLNDDNLVQDNLDAAKQYSTDNLKSQLKSFVQDAFDNKYFSQYGVKFIQENSEIQIGSETDLETPEVEKINIDDFIIIKLSYMADIKITKNMMPLVLTSAQDVVDRIKRSKLFDTDDVNVYDIITHLSESHEDYKEPFIIYILIRIPNLQNNIS